MRINIMRRMATEKTLIAVLVLSTVFNAGTSFANVGNGDAALTLYDEAMGFSAAASNKIGTLVSAWPVAPTVANENTQYGIKSYDAGSFNMTPTVKAVGSTIRTDLSGNVAVVVIPVKGDCVTADDMKHVDSSTKWIDGTAGASREAPVYYVSSRDGKKVFWGFSQTGDKCLKSIVIRPDENKGIAQE